MNDKPLETGDLLLALLLIGVPVGLTVQRYFLVILRTLNALQPHPLSHKIFLFLLAMTSLAVIYRLCSRWNRHLEAVTEASRESENAILLGQTEDDDQVYLTSEMRTRHTQVIGTTSCGKSESVILPWAIQDIQNRTGLIIVDGKADRSFLDKIYAYTVRAGRASDFRLFSLSNPNQSCTFNPLAVGSVQEITERVFSSFQFESEYFESVQFRLFRDIIALIKEQHITPTFAHILLLLTSQETLAKWVEASRNGQLKASLKSFNSLSARDRDEKSSGLISKLSHFCADEVLPLFNAVDPHIDLGLALKHNWICYFQLPTMYFQFLGSASGKLVLQCLQSAVAKRHNEESGRARFVSVFLDDFQDYIYEGFEALLNKSRSANIGMVFSHQALGDLDKVSPAFRNVVTTNTNIKIVMRNNDPDTAEFFANSFGTKTSSKETERVSRGLLGSSKTGELSVRAVEEFLFHPNIIKAELRTGEAIVSLPYFEGVKTERIAFKPLPDLKPAPLPNIPKGSLDQDSMQNPPCRNEHIEINRVDIT